MTLKLLQPGDIPAVAALEAQCFHTPWSAAALAYLTGSDAFGVVCLDEGGAALAYAGITVSFDDGALTNVATAPAARRRGYAFFAGSARIQFSRRPALRKTGLSRGGQAPPLLHRPRRGGVGDDVQYRLKNTRNKDVYFRDGKFL